MSEASGGDKAIQVRLGTALTDLTRKERRTLLGLSAASYVIAWTGHLPTTVLGFPVTPGDRSVLLKVFAGAAGYFLASFVIYALSGWLARRWAHQLAIETEVPRLHEEIEQSGQRLLTALRGSEADLRVYQARADIEAGVRARAWQILPITTPILVVRDIFELIVPMLAGIVALIGLFRAW
jgi:hypothetical protein